MLWKVSHDPDRKIKLPKGTKFKDVLIGSCLYKRYPQEGKFAGGIIFHRFIIIITLYNPKP